MHKDKIKTYIYQVLDRLCDKFNHEVKEAKAIKTLDKKIKKNYKFKNESTS